jgi:uncharacterized protein YbjQ (UPF0145 family)
MSDKITISQALRKIAKLKGQIGEYRIRACAGVSYRAESKPAFDFKDCMIKATEAQKELLNLQTQIAIANAKTTTSVDGKNIITIAEAVLKLQQMKGDIAWLKTLVARPQTMTEEKIREYDENTAKYIMTSVKWMCDMSESERADAVEYTQKEFDELNDAVERVNHTTIIG